MNQAVERRRRDALAIWQAGLDAARSEPLVANAVVVQGDRLSIGGCQLDLGDIRRIAVVGAGKAGAGMAAGLEAVLGESICRQKQLHGWINVPADCVRPLTRIHLHAARPAALNEPTPAGVEGTQRILDVAGSLGPDDLCLALISGGASALLPLPIDGITLDDKLAVTRLLSAAGAPIDELNTVRQALSQVKAGGLARACRAGRLVALIISDVLGDPLALIGSGPTVPDPPQTERALALLEHYGAATAGISSRVFAALRQPRPLPAPTCAVTNLVIGNNALAVEAAVSCAARLGYQATGSSGSSSEGPAEEVAARLVAQVAALPSSDRPQCLISGGEPTVRLVETAQRGLGGRNQQLVLAASRDLASPTARDFLLLSGGTDGEDGPTDAAGAWIDRPLIDEARRRGLDADDYLRRNDAYRWFEPLGGLIKTGPTHTNVCDLRVVLRG